MVEPTSPPTLNHPMTGLGIYVHFPWCLKKCPYCDFLSVAVKSPDEGRYATRSEAQQTLPHAAYADAVINEFEARFDHLWRHPQFAPPRLRSVFFGGGTPSLWEPRELGRALQTFLGRFLEHPSATSSDLEITVECNPTSVDADHFKALLDVGVNRISIGVQGLDQQRLEFLGRLHDPSGALRAIDAALRAGVPKVSADLIYGLYQQSPEQAAAEVTRVAGLGVHHVSAYMLTIEENTRFGALHARGKLPLLDDELVAASYARVDEALGQLGFEHYEVSNFARDRARSVHNVGYWLGRDYLGLGTGAFGTVSLLDPSPEVLPRRLRYRNFISPERYLQSWSRPSSVVDPFTSLSTEQEWIDADTAASEALLLGLRLSDGVDLDIVEQLRGPGARREERWRAIDRLVASGKLKQEGNSLRLPAQHWIMADSVIRELL